MWPASGLSAHPSSSSAAGLATLLISTTSNPILSHTASCVIGNLYPAYASLKAVELLRVRDETYDATKWLMYWYAMAMFRCIPASLPPAPPPHAPDIPADPFPLQERVRPCLRRGDDSSPTLYTPQYAVSDPEARLDTLAAVAQVQRGVPRHCRVPAAVPASILHVHRRWGRENKGGDRSVPAAAGLAGGLRKARASARVVFEVAKRRSVHQGQRL